MNMRAYYNSGITRPYAFRRQQLQKLEAAIVTYEAELHTALYKDLGKSPEESFVTETGFVRSAIRHAISHLSGWMKPRRVPTNLLNFPSSSRIMAGPLGMVLIIAPWNYPLQLLFVPLIGAIAAGNCIILKPSEFATATAAVMKKIIRECFEPQYIMLVEGDGATVIPELMKREKFDHVFYTGSTKVGREIYKMAAATLTPVTLELGGKSPCIVTDVADIRIAARRITMTKFSNAGQMCVAPDYILVARSVYEELLSELKKCIDRFYTQQPEKSPDFGRIINDAQWERLAGYLKTARILHGGKSDKTTRYISPTIIDSPQPGDTVMEDEIFGPILPIIPYDTEAEALTLIARHPDPLAFYVFAADEATGQKWVEQVPSGGACINNCSWHLTNPALPFGGRGNSGLGAYHGAKSFETFSHKKSVMRTPLWFDPALKYPPFAGKMKLFKWLLQ